MKPMSQIQIQYFNIDAILIISKGTAYIFESDWLKPISKKALLTRDDIGSSCKNKWGLSIVLK